jgi:hypothetical protein
MRFRAVAVVLAMLSFGAGAQADSVVCAWTGYGGFGTKSTGTKCGSYKVTVDVTVGGESVRGIFQQQWRDQRSFEATRAADGKFKTTAVAGGGSVMDVTGVTNDSESTVLLDGYCRFDAKLSRKWPTRRVRGAIQSPGR